MINNKKAYKIFMTLPEEERKKLRTQHEIEEVENLGNKDWLNKFGNWREGHNGSFWNWLWMIHFKEKYKDVNIEDIGADMTTPIKINKKFEYPPSTRALINGKRHYDVGTKEKLPSVTTILSNTQSEEKKASLKAWQDKVGVDKAEQIKNEAASRGSTMHAILEDFIDGKERVDLTENGKIAASMAQQIIEKGLCNVSEIWGSEVTVYYPGLYAGATDLVGIYNDKPAIIDFKQSNKPKRREWIDDYKHQLAGYALAHNKVHGTRITSGVVLMCTKDNYFQEFVFEGDEFLEAGTEFMSKVAQYYAQRKE
jgi:genome maintenance exonuclease 1